MSPGEMHTKVVQELFESKILGNSQNPAKEIQKLKDLVNLQYEYDTGIAPSTSQKPTTKQSSESRSGAHSEVKKSAATRHPTSMSGTQSPRDPVQDLFTGRARKLETDKREKDAAEKASRQAQALAKKDATYLQQTAAISKQAKYASEEKQRRAEEKMARERVLKNIEADKVERKEREERRKDAARMEARRVSGSARPKQAYTTGTIARSVSSRPDLRSSGLSHQSDIRRPGSQVLPRGHSLASGRSTASVSHGERLDEHCDDKEYPDNGGYSNEEYSDQGYPDRGYTPRTNDNKPNQCRPHPPSLTRKDYPPDQRYASPRSGSSRPFSSQGIRLGRLGASRVSSQNPPTSFPIRGVGQRPISSQRLRPRADLSTRSSRPNPHPKHHNVIEDFHLHESARESPNFSSELDRKCSHPDRAPDNCSHCDRRGPSRPGVGAVCMPCVVKGCKGQWCLGCWDKMVVRKRAVGPRIVRPEGWQECPYRPSGRYQGGRQRYV